MVQLMQELKHRYSDRFIIIDTPPILPFAETRTIASLVDGIVLVVKERLVSMTSLKEAIIALEGMPILGAVYNEVEVTVGDDRYGQHYGGYRYSQLATKQKSDSVLETH
jgi:Mrp family chromosome partitioning ATPase